MNNDNQIRNVGQCHFAVTESNAEAVQGPQTFIGHFAAHVEF